jgi:hypothetical protein
MWTAFRSTGLFNSTYPLPTHNASKDGGITFLDVNSVLVLLHRVDVGDVADVSEPQFHPKDGRSTFLDGNSVLVLLHRVDFGDVADFRSHILSPSSQFDPKDGRSTFLDDNSVSVLLHRVDVDDFSDVSESHSVSIFTVRP